MSAVALWEPPVDTSLPPAVLQVLAERHRAAAADLAAAELAEPEAPAFEPICDRGEDRDVAWLLGAAFDPFDIDEALVRIKTADPAAPLRYVSLLDGARIDQADREGAAVCRRQAGAWMTLCSGRGVSMLARTTGTRLPLVRAEMLIHRLLTEVVKPDDVVAVIGSDGPEVSLIMERYRCAQLAWFNQPHSARGTAAGLHEAARFVARAGARYTLFCLGYPYDEAAALACATRAYGRGVAICAGDAFDRLAHGDAGKVSAMAAEGFWGRVDRIEGALRAIPATLAETPQAFGLWRRHRRERLRMINAARRIARARSRLARAQGSRDSLPALAG